MDKVYKDKPARGKKYDRIFAAKDTAKERAKVLSEARKPKSYTYGNFKVTIEYHKYLEDGRLKVLATATRKGKPVPVDNPLYYVNPPICVHDGTFHKETVDGKERDIHNFKEDPEEALKEIVGQTIALLNK